MHIAASVSETPTVHATNNSTLHSTRIELKLE